LPAVVGLAALVVSGLYMGQAAYGGEDLGVIGWLVGGAGAALLARRYWRRR
jgi:hypothetical protein